ncbi:MAG: phosphotransferase [Capsulimonadales bacterium]|nr:phosphotransferase [Capsulimonadales bacterium]
MMTYDEAVSLAEQGLLSEAAARYGLEGSTFKQVPAHPGGRNLLYSVEKADAAPTLLRIAFLNDRSPEEHLGEVEFVRYLHEQGGSVPAVLLSRRGHPLEEILCQNHRFFVCLFEKARGMRLADNGYRYREGVPLTEYFHNCGKVLGQLHRLSKEYAPVHRRYEFSEKYTTDFIDSTVPPAFVTLKERLIQLTETLAGLDRNRESYGMIHFDFNDGNYTIDYDTGQITVFDFDNACFGWYLFDVADLWRNGVGWIRSEPDADKRRAFMDDYFRTAIAGYRSETSPNDSDLRKLPLFLQATLMENVLDEFEAMRREGEEPVADAEMSYRIRCLADNIPYLGLFDPVYSPDQPFMTVPYGASEPRREASSVSLPEFTSF